VTTNIREFRDGDLAAVIALWQACDLTRPWNPPERDIELCRRSGHGTLFVAEAEDRIVGSVMVGHDGHRGWLYYVASDPEARGSGVGRQMVQAAEGWLRQRGIAKAQLLVLETNTKVVSFYQHLGFAVAPRIVMSKSLGPAG